MRQRRWQSQELERLTIDTFKEYGGWWRLDGMAEWLNIPIHVLSDIWDGLEQKGLLERKK